MVCSEGSFSQPPPASAAPLGETSFESEAPPSVIQHPTGPPTLNPSRALMRPKNPEPPQNSLLYPHLAGRGSTCWEE
ncbi:hypothetical protein CesoFtcFv8_023065 [Champsocephalus esox]|uniref:Uncharacterized protein n=1 Tax=Champsocephalus esox TaxID=159716 RepID=A0AAN8B7G9_9TELE|nr:hypothetical protein CesoFtcFv8_023065 [Champsocephalus esox]